MVLNLSSYDFGLAVALWRHIDFIFHVFGRSADENLPNRWLINV